MAGPAGLLEAGERWGPCKRNIRPGSGEVDGCGKFYPSENDRLTCASCECRFGFHVHRDEPAVAPSKKRASAGSGGAGPSQQEGTSGAGTSDTPGGIKKSRTVFTPAQKRTLTRFAEQVENPDQRLVELFSEQIGVTPTNVRTFIKNFKYTHKGDA